MTSEWKQISRKNGIRVYKRDLQGSEFKEFRGIVTVDASLSSFAALLWDAPKMASWMHKTEEVRVVEKLSDNERIAYMRFDFMPLGKRELIVKNAVIQNPDDFSVTYSMDFISDHAELSRSRHGMMENLTGHVVAKPLDQGGIEITYQCHVEPGIKLLEMWGASAVTNKLLSDTPYYTLKNARNRINQPEYRAVELSYIQEPDFA
ncbi:MAG: START domain-containing protein [Pseudomonadales bacterium]|nr:START domain-containing protein [Pseudomonadales bacterium]